MIKQKIIASLVGGTISVGAICYTYETFRFDNISYIYNNFDNVIKKYELMKENRDDILKKYNNLYTNSTKQIKELKNELDEKEKYIKILEEKSNEQEEDEQDKENVQDKKIENN